MSTLRHKHSWTKRPRSQFPQVISPLPQPSTPSSSTGTNPSVKAKETSQKGEALLKTAVALVRDADELFSQGVSPSDPRIQEMRQRIEKAMPTVYEYARESHSLHNSNLNLYLCSLKAFLKSVPDTAQNGAVQPHNSPPRKQYTPPVTARVSPNSNAHSPSTHSPPRVSLPQATPSAIQRPQPLKQQSGAPAVAPPYSQELPSTSNSSLPMSTPFSPMHAPTPRLQIPSTGMQSFPVQNQVPTSTHPSPATPSPSALVQPGSYPDTRRQNLPSTSRPPLQDAHNEASYTQSHLYDAAGHATRHQKMVLCAVHELLQKRSSRYTRQPWYEPPIGLSPEELMSGQEPLVAPMFHHHPGVGGQFQQYFRPTHASSPSPGGYGYHFHGNRSVAVGTCLPRSASME